MKKKSISFIIPLYNHLEQSKIMLESLLATVDMNTGHEIILVDDFSTDDTRAWLGGLSIGQASFILNSKNLGYARSCNIGAQASQGELLALLNNDLILTPGWLEAMLDTLELHRHHTALVGNVQLRVATEEIDHAGVELNPNGQFQHIREIRNSEATSVACIAVTGACMLLRRSDFLAVGGFDEAFVNGCEDIDLCFKLRASGRQVRVATQRSIRHHVSLSRDRSTRQNEMNSRRLFGKWRSEIKRELSEVWTRILRTGNPMTYREHVQGSLDAAFLSMPVAAARTLAEAALRREEAYWARLLDDIDANADVACRCTAHNMPFDAALGGYRLRREAEIVISNLDSARSFFVCGRLLRDMRPGALTLTLTVNGIQRQSFDLGGHRNFNVGLVAPLIIPGINNRFTVQLHAPDTPSPAIGDMDGEVVLLTHVVIDEHEVRQF